MQSGFNLWAHHPRTAPQTAHFVEESGSAVTLTMAEDQDVGHENLMERDELKLFQTARKAAGVAKDVAALKWFDQVEDRAKKDLKGTMTCVFWALQDENSAALRFLLQSKANVNAPRDPKDGWTPLHEAAASSTKESKDIVKLLLEARANANAKTKDFRRLTPLALAVEESRLEDSRLLGIQAFCEAGLGDKALLLYLIKAEGPDALEALRLWKRDANRTAQNTRHTLPARSSETSAQVVRAHLRHQLRVFLASPSRKEEGMLEAPSEYANLEAQNLYHTPAVQANLFFLPGLYASDACAREMLEALTETTNESIFETDVIQAVVSAAWMQMRASAWEMISNLLTVASLCYALLKSQSARSLRSQSHQTFLSICLRLIVHFKSLMVLFTDLKSWAS